MNKKIFEILQSWPKPYITGTDLNCLLDKSADSRYGIVKRAISQGYLESIRRDLYLIKGQKQPLLDMFEISMIVYGPSYISFESALSFHGWIPEGVRTVTCATVKRSKEFETPIGIFSYEHVPIKVFPLGIEQRMQKGYTLFMATPVKALADLIYARDRTWTTLDALSEDLRIEPENFTNSDYKLLKDLIRNYSSK